jgi:hypothetical protein
VGPLPGYRQPPRPPGPIQPRVQEGGEAPAQQQLDGCGGGSGPPDGAPWRCRTGGGIVGIHGDPPQRHQHRPRKAGPTERPIVGGAAVGWQVDQARNRVFGGEHAEAAVVGQAALEGAGFGRGVEAAGQLGQWHRHAPQGREHEGGAVEEKVGQGGLRVAGAPS